MSYPLNEYMSKSFAALMADDFGEKDDETRAALRSFAGGIQAMLDVSFSDEVIVGFAGRLLGIKILDTTEEETQPGTLAYRVRWTPGGYVADGIIDQPDGRDQG